MVPVEIGLPTLRVENFNKIANDEALMLNLDLLEEKRTQAQLRRAEYQN